MTIRPQALPDAALRDMGVLSCAERVRSFLREPGCCLSREQTIEDFEVVFASVRSAIDQEGR